MTDYQGEKFKDFLYNNRISTSEAAERMGVSRQAIYLFFKTVNLHRETVRKILDTFKVNEFDIWGRENIKTPRMEAIPSFVYPDKGLFEGNNHRYAATDEGIVAMRVPIVPAKAQLGYFRGYGDPEYSDGFDFEIIDVEKEHFGNYSGFETAGKSMVNLTSEEWAMKSIFPGRYAIGRELDRDHWRSPLHIKKNKAWIIAHRTEGVILKEILEHDVSSGMIKVHSWNPDKETYPDEELWLGDIAQLFNVVKVIDRRR